ncbi:uncharacterized protein BJAS_P1179 [Bathymodiolus japonicus methanotrophic gill symbiont]|uniref:lysophospholipid acyltransferase family protein n=1 Tax=Bathymodiolus japonicus methanotrophic gill symbiont TaxID=113269 RepID=UPI001B5355D3|nr:lysophospholipid acyltransferase family protein [Bathymodiolus japonicus methanotrophic gill symbiont]GFO71569.1 uncharacterized protein BJAS_P1179 [Bathymodiolus japonicus methanotrophic gill symbiont]
MKLLNTFIKQKLVPSLIFGYVKILQKTCKVQITGSEQIQSYIDADQPMLPCYWHQQMTFAIHFLLGLCQQGVHATVLVSPSKDGNIGDAVLTKLGIGVLRGSAHRTGAMALRDVYLTVSKEKCSVGAAVDGSLGPAREAKVGSVVLAQLSGAPIIPVANACSRKIYLNGWDHFFLPLPFSKVHIMIGQPIEVGKRVMEEEITQYQQQLTDQLNYLSKQAEQSFD